MTPEERAAAVYRNATGPLKVKRYACDSLESEIARAIREALEEAGVSLLAPLDQTIDEILALKREAQDARATAAGHLARMADRVLALEKENEQLREAPAQDERLAQAVREAVEEERARCVNIAEGAAADYAEEGMELSRLVAERIVRAIGEGRE